MGEPERTRQDPQPPHQPGEVLSGLLVLLVELHADPDRLLEILLCLALIYALAKSRR